ncbi:senescence/dehydration-associated protein-like protein [Actinidia rufa]|uniref:Senescence/dehydration-associated protein-like protein n=1 Tax=Actinidia rufa TaxID=165716 RepID=A0A7J0E5B3_9ERIC|nr:senescence/dehydration-associated protein-like protein [Actinidia rufa]
MEEGEAQNLPTETSLYFVYSMKTLFLPPLSKWVMISNGDFTLSYGVVSLMEDVNWREFAPVIEDYNNFLAKAIAGGTGQIVKGIFKCSNAYTNQMTEKMSKVMLDGVGIATGSVLGPVVRSQAGKAFLAMVHGEVLLASLDAVHKVLDAADAAEKQALSATSAAAARMVSQKLERLKRGFGESAGEATKNAFAMAGHCASTAWNVFKIRKAINPASSISSGVL